METRLIYHTKNLTLRIRTASVLVSSDWCYPREEREGHTLASFGFNIHSLAIVETSTLRGNMHEASV